MVICRERGADCLHMVQLMPLLSQNFVGLCFRVRRVLSQTRTSLPVLCLQSYSDYVREFHRAPPMPPPPPPEYVTVNLPLTYLLTVIFSRVLGITQ